MDPSAYAVVSAAVAKRSRSLRYDPVRSTLSFDKRRDSVTEWDSTTLRFSSSAIRRYLYLLPGPSTYPPEPPVVPSDPPSFITCAGVTASTSSVLKGSKYPHWTRAFDSRPGAPDSVP